MLGQVHAKRPAQPAVPDEQPLRHVGHSLPDVLVIRTGESNWDRGSLQNLLDLAMTLGILGATASKLADAANEFRDAVHPRSAARNTPVARAEDDVLRALVFFIHARLDHQAG
jgi:hypothetical protein